MSSRDWSNIREEPAFGSKSNLTIDIRLIERLRREKEKTKTDHWKPVSFHWSALDDKIEKEKKEKHTKT